MLPSDGPTGKSNPVSVTAYWGSVKTPISFSVLGTNSSSFAVKSVEIYEAYSVVNLIIAPAMAVTAGTITIRLISSDQVTTTFDFDVFNTPTVVSLQPSQGTVDGRVGDCATCLTNVDGNTVSIWVQISLC